MAHPTVMRSLPPPGSNAFDHLRHTADLACRHGAALLTGQYSFAFQNRGARTAKLHIAEDASSPSSDATVADTAPHDFFLTLPSDGEVVTVPMRSRFVRVTAGFFCGEPSHSFEIFWEARRFAWEPHATLVIKTSHSTETNKFRADVWPGALEANGLVLNLARHHFDSSVGSGSARNESRSLLFGHPDDAESSLDMLAFSRGAGGTWSTAASVTGVAQDGRLQMHDGKVERSLKVGAAPCLIAVPRRLDTPKLRIERAHARQATRLWAPGVDFLVEDSCDFTFDPTASSIRAASPLPAPIPDERPSLPSAGGAAAAAAAAPSGPCEESFKLGEGVEFWSSKHGSWLDAKVVGTFLDGGVIIEYGASKLQRRFAAGERGNAVRAMRPTKAAGAPLPRRCAAAGG
mmetsp:Transcript_176305/g.565311  ORF Transcript_176305/g.565311 Transcript_176305/m.565311 type:complete len:403 (-) Transcript_176305:639-1847(-)